MFTLGGIDESFIFVVVGGGVVALWVVCATAHAIYKRGAFERSRREIAAYIAEGSMTPEDGERLLVAESQNMKDA